MSTATLEFETPDDHDEDMDERDEACTDEGGV